MRGDAVDPPILVWSRHHSLFFARHSQRLEERTARLGAARLVLGDTWTSSVVE